MPTAQHTPPVPRASARHARAVQKRSRAPALRTSTSCRGRKLHGPGLALALALAAGACQDPHYAGRTENVDGEPGTGSLGADASASGSSARDASSAQKRDAAPSNSQLDAASTPRSSGETPDDADPRTTTPGDGTATTRPDAAAPDGEPPVVSTVPAWALPLVGRYATRWFAFKQDDFGTVVRAEQLAIVEFALEGKGMTLRSKLCLSTGDTSIAQLRLVDASGLPERREQVMFSDLERSWSTEGPTYATGFTLEQPEICASKQGQSVPKTAAQAWLSGATCRCTSPGEEPLVDDCRILDPDRDQKPGSTYTLKGFTSSLADETIYAATETDSHYVNGKVGVDGALPSANIAYVDRNYQLGCEPAGCANIAVLGRACPISFNHALFAALAAGKTTTCADLMSNVNTLFPAKPPDFPARCFQ